jgi:hypothetical protein
MTRVSRYAAFVLNAALICCFILFSIPLHSQTLTTGQVMGRVTDPSGAAIPAASVELQDAATGTIRKATTDQQGQYTFALVTPGRYSVTVTATGFQKAILNDVTVEVSKSITVNLALRIGQVSQIVQVTATPGAELQTTNATVGSTIGGNTLLMLPSVARNTTSLLLLQPMSTPQQTSNLGSASGGQVAGARSDQNAIMLDGGEITNPTSGNSDYYSNFSGGPEGSIPTPIESIQEFKVETNNRAGSFNVSSGAAVMLVTKRGTNQFHGSLYEYHLNSALEANTWDLNRVGRTKPLVVDNRFGGSLGGHVLPGKWKSYFFVNYEGHRLPENVIINRLVPTSTLKNGQLRFRDASGQIVTYDLMNAQNISMMCGPAGTGACDPRLVGLNPLVGEMWNKYMPPGNNSSLGDGLNTTGFTANEKFPVDDNFGVIRVDHTFNPKVQWMASLRYFREDAGSTRQTDIGGLLSGDTLGVPVATSVLPRQPRFFVTGITSQLTPTLVNDFHFNYMRDWWQWGSVDPFPQVAGTAGALVPGGDSTNALVPINLNTGGARTRLWNSHNFNYRDDLSWVKGNHLVQVGGSWSHYWTYFQRDDNQLGSLISLQYFMENGNGLSFPGAYRPPTCTSSLTTDCLPSSQISNWDNLYAQMLGMVDTASILRVRDASLKALPEGSLLRNTVRYDQETLYGQDTWQIRPSLTLAYGLSWAATVPPVESDGRQMLAVYASSGKVIDPAQYLEQRQAAALSGKVFNPTVGWSPIQQTGRKYPFDPVWSNLGPRFSVAWNPTIKGGFLGKIFGEHSTVLRGGFSRFFDRLNGVFIAINGLQVAGFSNTDECIAPSTNGQCLGFGGTDATNAFRVGVDGSTAALPTFPATATAPILAGLNGNPNVSSSNQLDPTWKPGVNQEWDFTLQRSTPGKGLLEVGYVFHKASNLYEGLDLNQVPFFMVSGGQSFAQAFDALAKEIKSGSAITPQPFFETSLAGSSFCGSGSCTAGVVSKFGGSITSQQLRSVFDGIQQDFVFGPAINTQQITNFFYYSDTGHSNYNAGFISYHVRAWRGLTMDANFTYSHSLDTTGVNQDYDRAVRNSYNPNFDYGTSLFDRKYNFNLFFLYDLPFRSPSRFINQIIGGWEIAPIFTAYSGLPLDVLDGSQQEFGQTAFGNYADAIQTGSVSFGGVNGGVAGSNGVGTNGNPAKGGTGLNIFGNPAAAYAAFRPVEASVDTTSRGGTLRGLGAWDVDMTLAKKFSMTERANLTFSAQFFNMFNHVNFADPTVRLTSPQSFGVITSQANNPRAIELGLHLDF